jgi:asparaginyl-tRNA synthetase
MILHKQIAVREGLGKLFVISPNVRLEHPGRKESGRHLFEFSQVDFEIAHGTMYDVFSLMERYLKTLSFSVRERCGSQLDELGRNLPGMSEPFPRYTTSELRERYGDDWEPAASRAIKSPFWAISHKREFYDKEDKERPGHYLNYDLIYPEGFGEALSGAEREHEYDVIMRKIERHGLDKSRYKAYLDVVEKDGLMPSAGGGFGVERLVRFLAGARHVGDVQLFRRVPGEEVVV